MGRKERRLAAAVLVCAATVCAAALGAEATVAAAALPVGEVRRGISLLHLSEGRPWRVLPVILALWSPDFPHAQAFALCPRPSGPLEGHFTLFSRARQQKDCI